MKRILMCFLFFFLWTGTGYAREMSGFHTVGIVADDQTFAGNIDWFKAGMVKYGHIEGENTRYIFYGFTDEGSRDDLPGAERIGSDNPDIIFSLGNYSAVWAKEAIAGTDIPAVFSMISSDPIKVGIVESLGRPKGNMTGIRVPDSVPKALEWLVAAIPGAKKVFVPYDPADSISVLALEGLDVAAEQLGIELVIRGFNSVDETVAAIETLPEDTDAIFRLPCQPFELRNSELNRAASKRNIPQGAAAELADKVLVTFSPVNEKVGMQAARMVNQIFKGVNPADLPIETSQIYLTINLKVAEKMGIRVPDAVLVNANTIIR
jgi:putative ABC transport system substrate-binding protein